MKIDTDVDFTQFVLPKAAADSAGFDEKTQPISIKAINIEKRQVTGIASSEIVDRDGEIVSLSALKAAVSDFMQNPVLLASHQHRLNDGRSPVVGSVIDYKFQGRNFIIVVQFANTELAESYWQLYKDRHQRAFSIGFRILDSKSENREGRTVRVITSLELYEISCVPVGANQEALVKSRQNFAQRKAVERQKQRILNNDEAYIDLIDRTEKLCGQFGDVFSSLQKNPEFTRNFTPAEMEILKDLDKEADELYAPDTQDWPFDEIDDLSDGQRGL